MRIAISIASLLFSMMAFSQTMQVYGLDFDYKTLAPKDTFSHSAHLPKYYVRATYKEGHLTDLDIFEQEDWMKEPLHIHARVVKKEDTTFFVYDGGKTKSGGYGRLLSRKVRFSDTAMLKNDTLIFKRTTPYSIQLHYATGIFSDSIAVAKKVFPLEKKNSGNTLLLNFRYYPIWNELPTYSRYYQIAITPKRAEVVKAKKQVEDGSIDYSFSYLHEQDYFSRKKMPASMLWIKHFGII